MKVSLSTRLATLALVPVLGLAACDRSPAEPGGHELLGQVVILDRSTTPHTPLATWTYNGGWDRTELVQLSHSAEANRTRISVGARIFNRGGEQMELSRTGEYAVRYGVASDPAGVVNMNFEDDLLFHGDHVHIYGHNDTRTTGAAELVFALWHLDHSDGETTPIRITFTE
jgi:hypothetical protein